VVSERLVNVPSWAKVALQAKAIHVMMIGLFKFMGNVLEIMRVLKSVAAHVSLMA
jgi:hypothetical protein